MEKVLLTGASGFIGSTLLKFLQKKYYEVIPVVRTPHGLPNEVVLDFTDWEFPLKVRALPTVNVVIHLGAKIDFGPRGALLEPGLDIRGLYTPNVASTIHLARWAKAINAYFIFTSTAMVHGVNTPLITEESKLQPDSPYGCSKWLAEEVIQVSRVESLILRLAGVYGVNGIQPRVINTAIRQTLKGEVPTQYGTGAGLRNYVYVVDLAKIILACLEERPTGTHLVSGVETISIADMLNAICDILLPGARPTIKDGDLAIDQVVECSKTIRKLDYFKSEFRSSIGHIGMHARGEE